VAVVGGDLGARRMELFNYLQSPRHSYPTVSSI
jgi:hypothetical protein